MKVRWRREKRSHGNLSKCRGVATFKDLLGCSSPLLTHFKLWYCCLCFNFRSCDSLESEMTDHLSSYPTTAHSSGHPSGFPVSLQAPFFLSFSSSLHLPLFPSPLPVSASVFLLLVLVFHLSLLLPTTQGGSYLFSRVFT